MGKTIRSISPDTRAKKRRTLAPSKTSVATLHLLRIIAPLYMRFVLHFNGITVHNASELIRQFQDFHEHKTRLILAFRHPYGDEPQLFAYLFTNILKKEARKLGIPLLFIPHARFVHGYEVALWGDGLIRWVLPRMGAVPIHHAKLDSAGMKNIRSILANDAHPLALAPEGQVSYRGETLPRIESGTVRMGFWCAQDLKKANRDEQVIVLPLTVFQQFERKDSKKLASLLQKLESFCGLTPSEKMRISTVSDDTLEAFMLRLEKIEEKLNALTEAHYQSTYGLKLIPRQEAINEDREHLPSEPINTDREQQPPEPINTDRAQQPPEPINTNREQQPPEPINTDREQQPPEPEETAADRAADSETKVVQDTKNSINEEKLAFNPWQDIIHTALGQAEAMLGITETRFSAKNKEAGIDNIIDRVYKMRQECWDRIYPEVPENLSPLEKKLLDRKAGEAWFAMRHMELVDLLYYLDKDYLRGERSSPPSFNRIVETAYNFYDIASRLSGGNFSNRVNPLRRKAIISVCPPMNLTDMLDDYQKDWKETVQRTTAELADAIKKDIQAYLDVPP